VQLDTAGHPAARLVGMGQRPAADDRVAEAASALRIEERRGVAALEALDARSHRPPAEAFPVREGHLLDLEIEQTRPARVTPGLGAGRRPVTERRRLRDRRLAGAIGADDLNDGQRDQRQGGARGRRHEQPAAPSTAGCCPSVRSSYGMPQTRGRRLVAVPDRCHDTPLFGQPPAELRRGGGLGLDLGPPRLRQRSVGQHRELPLGRLPAAFPHHDRLSPAPRRSGRRRGR
jgi:hypothetical protein